MSLAKNLKLTLMGLSSVAILDVKGKVSHAILAHTYRFQVIITALLSR
jgi:hypothetical protein